MARKYAEGSSPLFSDTESDVEVISVKSEKEEVISLSSDFSTFDPNLKPGTSGTQDQGQDLERSEVSPSTKSKFPLLFGGKQKEKIRFNWGGSSYSTESDSSGVAIPRAKKLKLRRASDKLEADQIAAEVSTQRPVPVVTESDDSSEESHTFQAKEAKTPVVTKVPGYPSWFNIKYDGDASIYTYELEEDMRRGDLEILV